ncbi:hypothetical protein KKG15_02260 [Patescibacteria group bacterium]|nr:hypothetical protein [Patescibacteria group bacterium]
MEKIPQGKLIAVEKDNRFVEYLQKKFKNTKNLSIVHGDILKFDIWDLFGNCPPASLCEAFRAGKLGFGNYKIVANIPYYITSRFLRNFLQSDFQPSLIVVMIQKEVAERIVAKDGKESILSIAVKAYGQPRIVRAVAAKYFSPKPKVDSAILLIDNINCARLSLAHEKEFFNLVKQGFSSKRKLLKNNLKMLDTECLTACKIPEKSRAEDLSLENWKCLYKMLLFK